MTGMDERFLIYTALAILCSTGSMFLGLSAGIWTFVQVAAVIEIMYWVGAKADDSVSV